MAITKKGSNTSAVISLINIEEQFVNSYCETKGLYFGIKSSDREAFPEYDYPTPVAESILLLLSRIRYLIFRLRNNLFASVPSFIEKGRTFILYKEALIQEGCKNVNADSWYYILNKMLKPLVKRGFLLIITKDKARNSKVYVSFTDKAFQRYIDSMKYTTIETVNLEEDDMAKRDASKIADMLPEIIPDPPKPPKKKIVKPKKADGAGSTLPVQKRKEPKDVQDAVDIYNSEMLKKFPPYIEYSPAQTIKDVKALLVKIKADAAAENSKVPELSPDELGKAITSLVRNAQAEDKAAINFLKNPLSRMQYLKRYDSTPRVLSKEDQEKKEAEEINEFLKRRGMA